MAEDVTSKQTRYVRTLTGIAELFEASASLGRFRYEIEVYQDFVLPGPGHPEIAGLEDWRGRLLETDGLDLFRLQGVPLLMRLVDGTEASIWLDGPIIVFSR